MDYGHFSVVVLETHLVPSLLSVVVVVADSVQPYEAEVASTEDEFVPSAPPKIIKQEFLSIFFDSNADNDINFFILIRI